MQHDENIERETAKLRAHFEEKMTNKIPGHRRVAVLILYWDPSGSTVLDVSDEVHIYNGFWMITLTVFSGRRTTSGF